MTYTDLRRHTCTKDDPWSPDLAKRGLHPDATRTGERDGYPGGDIEKWHCPHCGVTWEQELPQ